MRLSSWCMRVPNSGARREWISRHTIQTSSADDLEDLRRALSVDTLSLLGHSYGTSLALAAVRCHGESLHRLVLASVQGPDEDLKLPLEAEFGLRRLNQFMAEDSAVNHDVPDLIASLRQALARLHKEQVAILFTDPCTGKSVTLRAGQFALQLLVEMHLKNGRSAPILPALISSVTSGDYSLFTALVTGLHQGFFGLSLMQFPMACSDGASMERRALAARQTTETLLGNPSDFTLDPKLCAEVGNPDLGPEFLSPIWSTIPALFLSGSMDSETPPGNAEDVRWGFPNSVHIIVKNGFHETLPAREVQDLVVDFFKGQDVSGRRVHFDRPAFLSLEQAKAQILAPSRPH
jgi:pimeloyl-ACP methyl ester carboxylesterase